MLSLWGFCISLQDNNIYRFVRLADEIVDSFHGYDKYLYLELKPSAQKLGSAFQKVNFLRDTQVDFIDLDRTYFLGLDFNNFF
mgnify:CR=1 FL=1